MVYACQLFLGIDVPKSKSSLHTRIRSDIEKRIRSNEWSPGFRIPSEMELMEQWNCSRMTVHKAVAALATEGLVERNRRAGTVVARPRMHAALLRIPDIRADIEARGLHYSYKLRKDEKRAAANVHMGTEHFALGPSRFLHAVHFADDRALVVEERHIFTDEVPEASQADFSLEAPGSWLLSHVPWTDAEHRISAISAAGVFAKELEVARGAPCLLLERRTWRDSGTITIVRQTMRGDTFDFLARFKP
jgi:GntR family transcriptional regulator, histidine utilization repressor